MNSNLLFEFTVDKAQKTITVKREFAAHRNLVWDAWTKPELLDQWWAPRPYRNRTKTLDFREGGYWLYCMISPAEEIHWARADYQSITPRERFVVRDTFCDEEGNINTAFAWSDWSNVFHEDSADTTTVHITITYPDLAALEQIISMGFKEGFSMGLNQLDEWLAMQQ